MISQLDHYLQVGRDAGCDISQLERFAAGRICLQPRQLQASAAARGCDQPDGPSAIGYGGARGGGKSFWLLAQMGLDDCQRYPGLKCLLLRKVGKSNLENMDDLRRRLFVRVPHEFSASRGQLTFPNGSRIIAGHYQNESDIDSYLGLEYDVIGVEEATTLTSRKYVDISTCCRTSKPGWRPRIYSTTNPGGVGHAWYRQKFILPYESKTETDTRFIPARVTDNRFTNPEYAKALSCLNGWQKRAWFHGDWDIAAGQFFTNFRRDVHIVKDFDPNLATRWFAAMDYGYTHYTVILLGAKDSDGNMYVIDEHAERLWLPERHVRAFYDMLRRATIGYHNISKFVAGTDMFSRQCDGSTIAQQYNKLGIFLRPAATERVNGWAEILRRLGDIDAGIKPRLFIHERCRRLINCLPNLQHDPSRPEDVLKWDTDDDGEGGDDPADALRYLVQADINTTVVKPFRRI